MKPLQSLDIRLVEGATPEIEMTVLKGDGPESGTRDVEWEDDSRGPVGLTVRAYVHNCRVA